MTRALLSLLLLTACQADAAKSGKTGKEVGDRVAAFQASGHDSQKLTRPTVYAFLGTTCPTTQKYLGRLSELEKEFAGKVDFVYLYPNKTDSAEAKKEHHAQQKLGGLFIDDQGAKIAQLVGAQKTSEVIVVDKQSTIIYRGAIDDNKEAAKVTRRHLSLALSEHLAGKKVSTPKTEVNA